MAEPSWKRIWCLFKQVELPHDTETSTLGIYTKELKIGTQTLVYSSTFYNIQSIEELKCSSMDE